MCPLTFVAHIKDSAEKRVIFYLMRSPSRLSLPPFSNVHVPPEFVNLIWGVI